MSAGVQGEKAERKYRIETTQRIKEERKGERKGGRERERETETRDRDRDRARVTDMQGYKRRKGNGQQRRPVIIGR